MPPVNHMAAAAGESFQRKRRIWIAFTMTPMLLSLLMTIAPQNSVHPKSLLLSKWTAAQPMGKQKHFVVTAVIQPDIVTSSVTDNGIASNSIEWVEIEAVHSNATRRIHWRELRDRSQWLQGWQ